MIINDNSGMGMFFQMRHNVFLPGVPTPTHKISILFERK
jgi:hypothetical protein